MRITKLKKKHVQCYTGPPIGIVEQKLGVRGKNSRGSAETQSHHFDQLQQYANRE